DARAATLERTLSELSAAEAAFVEAGAQAERARQGELEGGVLKGDAERAAAHAQREAADVTAQVERLSTRLEEVEARLAALHGDLERHEVERVRLDERLGGERARLVDLEAQQEAAREQRVQWQVDAAQVEEAEASLGQGEAALDEVRRAVDARGADEHKLELERTEVLGRRAGVVARVEAEWRKPLDRLLAEAPEVAGDLEWLRQEDERLRSAIDAVGPVNALAVDEHAEETKRLEFLMTQRDDLVAARQP